MPALGAGMESGIVVEWHVEPGQAVKRGDVIGIVDTEKGAIDIEIWDDAEIAEILAPPGTEVPVGEPLLRLKVAGEDVDLDPREDEAPEVEPQEAPASQEAPAPEVAAADVVAPPQAPPSPAPRRRVSPLARRRAEALGVDPERVEGTGPGGAVTAADVEAAAGGDPSPPSPEPTPEPDPAPAPDPSPEPDRQAAMRRAIAAAMTRSKREIPHYYLSHTLSMESTLRRLEEVNRDRPPAERILVAALYIKAVAQGLEAFPELNGFWEDDAFRQADGIHPGLAISLRGGGLVAPALHDAPSRSLEELTSGIRDVVQRARAGRLRGSEVTDPTITVTSLGDRGVDTVFGVIHPPQVAIVGIGTVVERPWAEGGMVGSHRTVTLTLSADHRAGDGHRGSLFLARVAHLLHTGDEL
ncbi:MAG: 2-oxo acid dehydrogenase subunit E2 [Gemmatimonadales bacterium]|nr:MAG: 2-oxo acid dehydrogenase subunit E2 [Gemmatimonadales bacterium]